MSFHHFKGLLSVQVMIMTPNPSIQIEILQVLVGRPFFPSSSTQSLLPALLKYILSSQILRTHLSILPITPHTNTVESCHDVKLAHQQAEVPPKPTVPNPARDIKTTGPKQAMFHGASLKFPGVFCASCYLDNNLVVSHMAVWVCASNWKTSARPGVGVNG